MKWLVVTADDFGLSPGVVEGIAEAHERGIVTSTSILVNAPASEAAFERVPGLPRLAFGLHFNLTFGFPVGPREPLARLLDGSGRFLRLSSGVHRRARPEDVREELRAQLRAFEDGARRPPTHIDGHHHVHLHPGILEAVIEEASRLDVPVRSTDGEVRARLRLTGVRTSDRFLDGFYAEGGDLASVGEERMIELLEGLPEGTSELMCHPAREDPKIPVVSGYVLPRYRELETLTSSRVREALQSLGIELIPWPEAS